MTPDIDAHALAPWLLLGDWRTDLPDWLWVDLASWPADVDIDRLPPVPLVGVGNDAHPLAARMDLLVADRNAAAAVGKAVAATPQAAAMIVQVLRATEGLAGEAALTLESMAMAALQGGGEHARWLASRARAAVSLPCHLPGRLHVGRRAGRLDVVLDRPSAHNAIDRAMRDALFDTFSLAACDDGITELRLSARGRCFSLGADLAEFGTTRDPAAAHAIRMRSLPAWALLRRRCRFTVHVQGACVGSGLELAAFADRLTASPDAWFQLPEMAMGILPGFGGCVSLPRRIGRQRAAALMLTGRRIGARAALAYGLIDALVDDAPAQDGGADEAGVETVAGGLPGAVEQA